jgi:hypothetical protein
MKAHQTQVMKNLKVLVFPYSYTHPPNFLFFFFIVHDDNDNRAVPPALVNARNVDPGIFVEF